MYDIACINAMIDDVGRFFQDLAQIGLNEDSLGNVEKIPQNRKVFK